MKLVFLLPKGKENKKIRIVNVPLMFPLYSEARNKKGAFLLMKKIKDLFATPKKAIITSVCLVFGLGILVVGGTLLSGVIAWNLGIGNTAAEDIALKDAGTDFSQARIYRTQFDFDDWHYVYDVEFTANGMEYDYRIKASNGKIISRSSEPMEGYAAGLGQNQGAVSNQGSVSGQGTATISVEDAKRIALDHAGLAEDSVKFMNAYLEYDDGIEQYEVEFYKGTTEYSYAIDAVSGNVIGYSTESIFS